MIYAVSFAQFVLGFEILELGCWFCAGFRLKLSFFLAGIKESDTGLAAPSQWDLVSDKQMMQEEQPLQVCFRLHTWAHPDSY